MSNAPKFYARCSALGQIMTNDRSGKGPGQTCITYLNTWMVEQLTGQRKEVTSKYMQKGIECEPASIARLSAHLSLPLEKNERNYRNEWLTGTPDIVTGDLVADVKTAWDAFTMPYFEDAPSKDYWWQLQGYLWLTGGTRAILAHCLENVADDPAPNSIISRKARGIMFERGLEEIDMELWQEVLASVTFDHLPASARIKIFDIEPADVAQQITDRVEWCRGYVESEWRW